MPVQACVHEITSAISLNHHCLIKAVSYCKFKLKLSSVETYSPSLSLQIETSLLLIGRLLVGEKKRSIVVNQIR